MDFLKIAQQGTMNAFYRLNALKFDLEQPFMLKGGLESPVFCDTSVLETNIDARATINSALLVSSHQTYPKIDAIIGVVSGGVSWATMMANSDCLPLLRAHARPKNHGLRNQIDGELPFDGCNVLLIDDVITSGKAILSVIEALRAGKNGKRANVLGVYAIFDWDLPETNQRLATAGIEKEHIVTLSDVLDYGFSQGLLPEKLKFAIEKFKQEQHL